MTPGGIVVAGLHRRFGPVVALQGVDLEVPPGQIVALLGENGAGKTTLIRVLSNVLVPDAGRVSVAGHDLGSEPRAARARTGVVLGEERSFFWRLSGAANLEFFAALQGLRRSVARHRVEEVLAMVELSEVAGRRVDRYSSGMRARLGLARGLLGSPAVLLLDEPTRSLDPVVSIEVRNLVARLAAADGIAILFATHDLHEAAALSSATTILSHGRVAARVEGGTDAAGLERALLGAAR